MIQFDIPVETVSPPSSLTVPIVLIIIAAAAIVAGILMKRSTVRRSVSISVITTGVLIGLVSGCTWMANNTSHSMERHDSDTAYVTALEDELIDHGITEPLPKEKISQLRDDDFTVTSLGKPCLVHASEKDSKVTVSSHCLLNSGSDRSVTYENGSDLHKDMTHHGYSTTHKENDGDTLTYSLANGEEKCTLNVAVNTIGKISDRELWVTNTDCNNLPY